MIEAGYTLNGRYKLTNFVIGYEVEDIWQATDELLNRPVAVKIVKSLPIELQSDETLTLKDYFLREARIAARLLHPHILPVYDYGIDDNIIYIITANAYEYNLSEFIRNVKNTSLVEILRLSQRLASAIDFFHTHNIIHGDIKPSNILLGEDDHPYIVNFGLSHQFSQPDETQFDYVLGTPAYLAPEQIMNLEIDYRVDLYAFGVILYECLTGVHPYQSILNTNLPGLMLAVMEGFSIESISALRPELPIGSDVILRRLLHTDPSQRYQTASQAVDDLYRAFYSGHSNIDGKIFISYARKDSEYIHKLADELKGIGLDIWIDRDIPTGTTWADGIQNALNECDMMLLIITEAAMSSDYVTHEWSYFMGRGKPVYPFVPRSDIPKNIHPRLEHFQFSFGTDDMLSNVARIVDVLAGSNPTKLGGSGQQGV